MSRYQRDRQEIEGIHIDNDDLKDIGEDVRNIFEDLQDFMDLDYPAAKKVLKADAALRFSPNVQKLMKMVLADLGNPSEREASQYVKGVFSRWTKLAMDDPQWMRLVKTSERWFREVCKNINIGDLPTGQRERWVNHLAAALKRIMKSDTPVRNAEKALERVARDVFGDVFRYMRRADRMERKMFPNGGL